jgi:hypothetical protein
VQIQDRHTASVFSSKWHLAAAGILTGALPIACFYAARSLALTSRPQAVISTAPRPQPFQFQSHQLGRNVQFSWDPKSDEMRRAEHGHLTVLDGSLQWQFWLSKPELASGTYLYTPTGKQISARMDLYSFIERHELASIATAAAPAVPRESRQTKREIPYSASRSVRSRGSEPSPSAGLPRPIATAATSLAVASAAPNHVQFGNEARQRDEHQAAAPPNHTAPPLLPEPPTLSPPAAPSKIPELLVSYPSPPSRPQRVSVHLEPVRPSFVSQAIGRVPILRGLHRGRNGGDTSFVPARPVERPLPLLPARLGDFDNQATVECIIRIDRFGAVTKISDLTGNGQLADAGARALYMWRFEPARLRGNPVESHMRIEFTFGYSGR